MRKRKGFTLIELLVVISIILVLASVLTPALLKAREQANRSTCLANIRSIGQAMQIFANENEDKFPVFPSQTDPEAFTGGIEGNLDANSSFAAIYNAKTFNTTKVFVCPNRKRNSPPQYNPTGGASCPALSDGRTSKGDPVSSSGDVISYAIVLSWDSTTSGERAVCPMSTDQGSNVLLIEDPSAGGDNDNAYDDADNHGVDGTNTYCINGSAKWFKGAIVTGTDNSTGFPTNRDIQQTKDIPIDSETMIVYPTNVAAPNPGS